jgi:hypothetical protein
MRHLVGSRSGYADARAGGRAGTRERPRPTNSCAVAVAALLLVGAPARAVTTVQEISWSELKRSGKLRVGELVGDAVRLVSKMRRPLSLHLVTLEQPPMKGAPRWALVGKVKYQDVGKSGYLELWNVFANGAYFSRTLATVGPMRALDGSSDWRELALPFVSDPSVGPPQKLVCNLVLQRGGTVELGPLRLVTFDGGEDPLAWSSAGKLGWWGDRRGGLIGGVGGSACGLLGVLISVLVTLGRARRLALGLTLGMILVGAGLGAVGLVALRQAQPHAVYYPLLLVGGLLVVVMGCALPVIRRRYRDLELRRMAALDRAPRAL